MKISIPGFLLILIAFLFTSCGDPTAPENLLEEERYIAVFTELVILNQIGEENLNGVSREYLNKQIFEKYGVTKEQFEQTHRYYQQQTEEHLSRIDKIEDSLTDQRDQFQDRLNEDRKRMADSLTTQDTLSSSGPFTKPADSSSINNLETLNTNN